MFPKDLRHVDEELLQQTRNRPCLICLSPYPSDPHHVKTVKSGGGDHSYNLVSLCRKHHSMVHSMGAQRFCEVYPKMRIHLEGHGWEFVDGKLRRYK